MAKNRAERRADKRRKARADILAGLRLLLTPPEAEVVEEALALWGHQTRELLEEMGTEPTDEQTWALWRAEKIRAALRAGLENRPWKDLDPRREPPGYPNGEEPDSPTVPAQ